jgi:hypothetical protein
VNEYRQELLAKIGINKQESELKSSFWPFISKVPNLGELFIREFANKLDWNNVSSIQSFSNDFLLEFGSSIVWDNYFLYNSVDYLIIKKFLPKTKFHLLNDFESSHLTDVQKQEIQRLLNVKNLFKIK